jgi:hypothetical protein
VLARPPRRAWSDPLRGACSVAEGGRLQPLPVGRGSDISRGVDEAACQSRTSPGGVNWLIFRSFARAQHGTSGPRPSKPAKIEGEGGFVRDDGRMPIERLTEFSQLSKGEQKRGAGRPHGSSNTLSDKLHAIAIL